ncbi:MAG TPA: PLP-dependent aminotransferase family protein [Acidisoma sp.]|jgi:DNA-binding transcriptional MocR family regulator|uniref:aminotransferase-like domain-containing protein n=1 Tax=Acidisoma sp. TaxID=1872115 RepID=UPI002BAF5DB6|nr:PLP-dependent aminotransferase family protein [Acidisoma sp.]HTI02882.1 PLP-dependent aminotransferase family protein [Acidisoma sp.]
MRRYEQVVSNIRRRIEAGTLKPGERLPSVRALSGLTGFSMVTVHHAYVLLEGEGLIEARPRTGFFVTHQARTLDTFPDAPAAGTDRPSAPVPIDSLNFRVMASWHNKDQEAFGAVYPSGDIFPRRKINQTLRQVLLRDPERAPETDAPEGDPLLREIIARRAAQRGIIVRPRDVLITGGGLQGLDICVGAITKPGDTVLVETPTFFPLLDTLRRRHLLALEIYSHPKTGIDPDQFAHLLERNQVAACLLMPVNHYPTGVTYTEETMRQIVRLASARRVPIIENDIFGSLSYATEFTPSLKTFDADGTVIQFSSLPGLSSSGYGIGWIVSEQFYNMLLEQKFFTNLFAGDGPLQRAAAEYIAGGHYDRPLRGIRDTLAQRMQRGLGLIAGLLPKDCAVSRPSGGFVCWVRGPQGFDATSASRQALQANISLAPGPMFSPAASFRNFLALNFSFEWTAERIEKLKAIANLMHPNASLY